MIYTTAQTDKDLRQIIKLQQLNLEEGLAEQEWKSEGYVTAVHTLDLLTKMNQPHPHIIAKIGEEVIAYALVMRREFSRSLPILIPMFENIDAINYDGKFLGESNYFAMGQICIKKGFRGKGIFKGLYDAMKKEYANQYDYVITQIATRNPRSVRAHEKVGFKTILEYEMLGVEEWLIVLWDWK